MERKYYKRLSPEELLEKAEAYFKECDSREKAAVTKEGVEYVPWPKPYTLEGLCCFIGVPSSTFTAWRRADNEMTEAAQMIHEKITANRVIGGLDGSQNASFAMFMLKNNNPEVYRERSEVEHSVSSELSSIFDLCGKVAIKHE